jgi:hypothetical protein
MHIMSVVVIDVGQSLLRSTLPELYFFSDSKEDIGCCSRNTFLEHDVRKKDRIEKKMNDE